MWKLTVPDDVLETLRCSLCKEYLSQLPVYSYPNQEGVGCGRCPILSDQSPIRNTTYETIAQHLFFPCRFKMHGCVERVLPSQMEAHEETCAHKQYFCPLIPLGSCTWQGSASELFAHYEDHHKVLTLYESNPQFEVDLINMYEENYLLAHNSSVFLIHIKFDAKEKLFWSSVRFIGNRRVAKQYCYQIELNALNSHERIRLDKKVVQSDTSMNIDKSLAVTVDTGEIKTKLSNPCAIICHVYIQQNFITDDSWESCSPTTTIIKDESINEQMLEELECPVCSEYMVPPIHQCVAGHSICNTCKPQISECPTCRKQIEDTRNYSLENLSRHIKYCCKYRDYGCNFVTTSESIRNHENNCKHGPYECPFRDYNECKWKGKLTDVMKHVKFDHEDSIMDIDIVTFLLSDDGSLAPEEDCFLKNVHGNLFRVLFKYDVPLFCWSVQYIGPPEDSGKFMYEIDIIDNSGNNERLFVRKTCAPLIKFEDAFKDKKALCLDVSLVNELLNKQDLIYRCHISKK